MSKMGHTWEWYPNGNVKIFKDRVNAVIKNSNGKKSFINLGFFNSFKVEPETMI